MDRATVILAAITGPDDRIIDRPVVDPTDRELMTNPENGIAYIDPVYVAVRWCNRNPQWFSHDLDHKDEFAIIEAAINGELPAT